MTKETDQPSDGGALPATLHWNWQTIRARYEKGEEQVKTIAAEIGLASVTLSLKAKALGWKLRGAPTKAKLAIVKIRKLSKGETCLTVAPTE